MLDVRSTASPDNLNILLRAGIGGYEVFDILLVSTLSEQFGIIRDYQPVRNVYYLV